MNLTIPESAWQPNDALEDPRSRLLTTITINGHPMHLEAWAVSVTSDGVQEPTAIEDDDDFERFYAAVHADGHFQTMLIQGREYVLLASPYC